MKTKQEVEQIRDERVNELLKEIDNWNWLVDRARYIVDACTDEPKPKFFGKKCPKCGSKLKYLSVDQGPSWAWYTKYWICFKCKYEYAKDVSKFFHISLPC